MLAAAWAGHGGSAGTSSPQSLTVVKPLSRVAFSSSAAWAAFRDSGMERRAGRLAVHAVTCTCASHRPARVCTSGPEGCLREAVRGAWPAWHHEAALERQALVCLLL